MTTFRPFSLRIPFRRTSASRSLLCAATLGLFSCAHAVLAETAAIIDSGSLWLDTTGKPIDAHGGGFLRYEGNYYWYGEIKAGATTLPEINASWGGTRVPFTGVSCYSSPDFITWKFEGNVLPASSAVPELHPTRVVERPKVIFNRATRQFVMWMHIDSPDYKEARLGVAVADNPRGPFRYVGANRPNAGVFPEDMSETLRRDFETAVNDHALDGWLASHAEWKIWARDFKNGQMARDMTLFADDDGAAYVFYASEENAVMHVSRLSDDYLHDAGRYRRITFDSREAPAPFKWKGRYYLVSSGCTGWDPNPTLIHSAENIFGVWENRGSFFADNSSAANVSYLSQPCSIAPIEGRGLVFMADRWNKFDLQNSRYVWLPVETTGETPRVRWRQRWSLEAPLH